LVSSVLKDPCAFETLGTDCPVTQYYVLEDTNSQL